MPRAVIIAGPNGAGKTTFAREFLPNEGGIREFVNADLIAAGLSPFAPDKVDVEAGRIMIRRLDELVELGQDFGLETTLSGRYLTGRIRRWQAAGYMVQLYYLGLATPADAVLRVRRRVASGGHSIPEDVIHRRFYRSLELLESTYKQLVDRWMVFDNMTSPPKLIEEHP